MNGELLAMVSETLTRGFRALVLTNAMKPMQHRQEVLLSLRVAHDDALTLRVSIDHYEPAKHESVRGPGTWASMLAGMRWLSDCGFRLRAAGRKMWGESEAELRGGFHRLFEREGIAIDALDPASLVLFPEMDAVRDVPEITTECWNVLGKSPDDLMCASSRMVIRRKGETGPTVVPCTLLPYDRQFELGPSLVGASTPKVYLNHPYCAQFCVLGGASCSGR